jgi:hypothetical protein
MTNKESNKANKANKISKTLKNFIKTNRKELDKTIAMRLHMKANPLPDDKNRRLWILCDYYLYRWAASEGVEVV